MSDFGNECQMERGKSMILLNLNWKPVGDVVFDEANDDAYDDMYDSAYDDDTKMVAV